MDRLKIFLSYSHVDEELCNELRKRLKVFERAGLIAPWYDRKILPGAKWDDEIKENLLKADILLFLISPDFLNSDYIHEYEVKLASQRHAEGHSIIVPIMLRKCDIEYMPFKDLQGLPTDLVPIISKTWYNIDDAFANVYDGLKIIIHREIQRKEVLGTEEQEWQRAEAENTVAAYQHYLDNSRLKTRLEEVMKRVKEIDIEKYKREYDYIHMELQLKERMLDHISAELHDNVGQILSSLNLVLSWTIMDEHPEKDKHNLENMRSFVVQAVNEVRKIAHMLRSDSQPHYAGLKGAVLELESSLIKVKPIKFTVKFDHVENIDHPELEVNAYRIIQELCNNIMTHSKATEAEIAIAKRANKLLIKVSDNGIGIAKDHKPGMGLASIRSRINHYNGTLEIRSGEYPGTEILISIPLQGNG